MSDLINRQDAIDAIDYYLGEVKNIPMGTAFKEGVKDGYCRIRSIIMSLPPAERKRGEWIEQHDEYWGVLWYECSVCGHKPPNNQFGQEWHSNYCAFCGADMRGDKDDKG